MGQFQKLTASDGHVLDAYVATPEGTPIGGLVVVQEIFGVNAHIRRVADGYAKDGFLVVAPAIFDRIEKNVELAYEGEDWPKAVGYMQKLDPSTVLKDVAAAFEYAKQNTGKAVSVVGYCYGGFTSWLSATRGASVGIAPACCVGYYPGGVGTVATEQPTCPVMLHFGAEDTHIGPEQIEAVRNAHPDVTIYVYEGAEHGFNCDARSSYNPASAALARERSLAFLKAHLG